MQRLETMEDLAVAVAELARREPRFGVIAAQYGLPPLRHADAGLECLLRIVTDQLISLKAGEAIWRRLAGRFGRFDPALVLAAEEGELRALGLSGAKARTFRAAAAAFGAGRFDPAPQITEDELFRRLTEIPGVGPWTASIYLLMAARAGDAWPAADLALQLAAQDLFDLAARPGSAELTRMAEPWRPWRSTAALLLWRHYRAVRGLPAG